jgi:hypothetical protein
MKQAKGLSMPQKNEISGIKDMKKNPEKSGLYGD